MPAMPANHFRLRLPCVVVLRQRCHYSSSLHLVESLNNKWTRWSALPSSYRYVLTSMCWSISALPSLWADNHRRRLTSKRWEWNNWCNEKWYGERKDHGLFRLDRTVAQFISLVNREETRDGLNNHLRCRYRWRKTYSHLALSLLLYPNDREIDYHPWSATHTRIVSNAQQEWTFSNDWFSSLQIDPRVRLGNAELNWFTRNIYLRK